MPRHSAAVRRDLIHFGIKKRVAGHLLGLGVLSLRLGNLLKPNSTLKKVLILEPFGLGDIISLEPLVRVLKQRGYQIGLAGKKPWKALYPEDRQLQWIDSELPWASHNEKTKYALRGYASASFRSHLEAL